MFVTTIVSGIIERPIGFEPTIQAWEACVLPLTLWALTFNRCLGVCTGSCDASSRFAERFGMVPRPRGLGGTAVFEDERTHSLDWPSAPEGCGYCVGTCNPYGSSLTSES